MNGPEHYAEAERLLAYATEAATYEMTVTRVHAAQVHATLAHTAAQLHGQLETSNEKIRASSRWRTALGVS